MNIRSRGRDIFVEILIAVVLVTVFVGYLFSLPKGAQLDWQRIALVFNTFTVFGLLISWFRDERGRLVFWAAFMVLLLVHTAMYAFVLSGIQGIPLSVYIVLNPVELSIFSPILRKILTGNTARRQ